MRVICPWCRVKDGKETSLRRMSELKTHVVDLHRDVSLSKYPADFFSEANGFYMAMYPKDYVQIVAPSGPKSKSAELARAEISRWLSENKASHNETERWNRDWKIAEKVQKKKTEGKEKTSKRQRPFTPEEEFRPDYEDEQQERSKSKDERAERKTREEPPEKKKKESETEKKEDEKRQKAPRRYEPTDPDAWTVKNISVTGKSTTADIKGDDNVIFRVTLKDNLWKEPKIFSSLMRRSETANYDESFEPPSQWNDVDRTTWQGVEEDLAAAAGIPTNMIANVQQGQLIPDYQPTAKETGEEEGAEEVSEMEREEGTEGERDMGKGKETEEVRDFEREEGTQRERETEKGEGTEQVRDMEKEGGTEGEREMKEGRGTEEEQKTENKGDIEESVVDEMDDDEIEVSPLEADEIEMTPRSPAFKPLALSTPPAVSVTPQLTISPVISHTSSLACTTSAAEVVSSEYSDALSTAHPRKTKTVQKRALKLLETGCMPLFPPAKREWGTRTVNIPSERTSITWPPTDWRSMTADQKLMQWEFVAMSLHTADKDRPRLERTELLAHYNMMALPGSAVTNQPADARQKMRFYNYDVLRKIATSKLVTAEDEQLVSIFEQASSRRSVSVDSVLTILREEDIKLRI